MASPTLANSPNTVKFEHLTPSSATPRVSINVPASDVSGFTTPRPSIGTGENTISQEQNGEPNSREGNTKSISQKSASLFDPSHLPSIYERLQRISKLVIQASEDPNSLTMKDVKGTGSDSNQTQEKNQQNSHTSDLNSGPAPNIALGATTDDDINSGYETALSMSVGQEGDRDRNAEPTVLAKSIVQESVALRQAFIQAQRAIDTFEGGDMDIEEQEHLISLLEEYSEEQK